MTDTTSQEALPVVAWESSGDWTDDAEVGEFFEFDPTRVVRRFTDHAAATAIIDALRAQIDGDVPLKMALQALTDARVRAETAETERDALRADAERYRLLRRYVVDSYIASGTLEPENSMVLSGDENVPAMPLAESGVNHLRRLLAWMRCEYTLDPDAQRGYLLGAHESVAAGFASPERASEIVQQKADEINCVPIYIRQGVKMLTKALRDHERAAGVVESTEVAAKSEGAKP